MIFAHLLGGPLDGLIVAAPGGQSRLTFWPTAAHFGGVLSCVPADPFERALRPDLPAVHYEASGGRVVGGGCSCALCTPHRFVFTP